jgi:hypothetical protein
MGCPWSAVLAAALAVALIAGCGGGSDGDSSSIGSTDPATSPEPDAGKPEESRFEGGEEDVEEFGAEAEGPGKAAVLAAERSYLTALAAKSYDSACKGISRSVTASLAKLVQGGGVGCAAILPNVLAPTTAMVARQQLDGRLVRVRVEGDLAFVIFKAPGARLWVMPMRRERGHWKATALVPTVLAPSAATLGQ